VNILLLTESETDPALFTRAVAHLPTSGHWLSVRRSPGEAWEAAAGTSNPTAPLPELIFLDFELSKSYDHELLRMLKSDDLLKGIPVVMVGTSEKSEDVWEAYRHQISCYVSLPEDDLSRLYRIHACLTFWSTHAILPSRVSGI
jgi:CheY-like chemotaxis protein